MRALSNPSGKWVNEHQIKFTGKEGAYAIVFFQDLQLETMIVFPKLQLRHICERLGKKHPEQDRRLELTQCDFKLILAEKSDFVDLGLRIWCYDSSQQQWKEWKKPLENNTEQ